MASTAKQYKAVCKELCLLYIKAQHSNLWMEEPWASFFQSFFLWYVILTLLWDPVYIVLSNLTKWINFSYIFNLLWNPSFCKGWKCYTSVFIKSQILSPDSQIVHADFAESSNALSGLIDYIFKEITAKLLFWWINQNSLDEFGWN